MDTNMGWKQEGGALGPPLCCSRAGAVLRHQGWSKGRAAKSILLGQHQPCCAGTARTGHGWITLGTAGDSDPKTGEQQGAGGLALRGQQPQTPLEEESPRGQTCGSWTGWVAQPHPAGAMGCLAAPCCTRMDRWHFPIPQDIPVPWPCSCSCPLHPAPFAAGVVRLQESAGTREAESGCWPRGTTCPSPALRDASPRHLCAVPPAGGGWPLPREALGANRATLRRVKS